MQRQRFIFASSVARPGCSWFRSTALVSRYRPTFSAHTLLPILWLVIIYLGMLFTFRNMMH